VIRWLGGLCPVAGDGRHGPSEPVAAKITSPLALGVAREIPSNAKHLIQGKLPEVSI
jgi:hypothetical protein